MPRQFFADCRTALGDRVAVELLQSQIEVLTPVCDTPDEALAHLRASRAAIDAAGHRFGLAILASGTNPLGEWREQVQTERQRYEAMGHDLGMLAQRNMLCGMHVHVRLPNADRRVDVMTRLIPYLPQLLALSTSSPFWNRQRSGLKGYRLAAYDELPRTGLPPAFASQAHYDTYVAALVGARVIPDASFTWWAAAAFFAQPPDTGAAHRRLLHQGRGRRGHRLALSRTGQAPGRAAAGAGRRRCGALRAHRGNKSRPALRPGLRDGRPVHLEPVDTRTLIMRLVEEVMPDAEALDCAAAVRSTLAILSRGTSADGQLDVYQRARRELPRAEALRAVVRWLMASTIDVPERAVTHDTAERASA